MKDFEWDQNKREHNLQKHGIDFIDGIEIFDDSDRIECESTRNGETRFLTIGCVNDIVLLLVYIQRGAKRRIISVRRASKNERQAYEQAKE
jgi:uncharacterized DUF497 family protein